MLADLLYGLPIALVGTVLVAIAVGASVGGVALVYRLVPVETRRAQSDIAGFIIAVVGVVQAVLLAFIAVAVWEAFNEAEEIVRREANLVGDLYRDTADVPDPLRGRVREHIREYLEVVINAEWPEPPSGTGDERAWLALEAIQGELGGAPTRDQAGVALFAEELRLLNALYDARRDRLLVARHGLQPVVWAVVVLGSVLTVAFTFFFGVPNLAAHMAMTGALAASIALVLVMIVALEHPLRGAVRITPEAFEMVLDDVRRLSNGSPSGVTDR